MTFMYILAVTAILSWAVLIWTEIELHKPQGTD